MGHVKKVGLLIFVACVFSVSINVLRPSAIQAAAGSPVITSGFVDEPIVSVDGNDIQSAHILVRIPGKLSAVKSVTISMASPNVPGTSLGRFSWSPSGSFVELTGSGTGSEFVNLLAPDANNPDTTSRIIFSQATKTLEIIYRWTMNINYGSTFNNDVTATLRVKTAGSLLGESVAVSPDVVIDSSFDTNTPPLFVDVSDIQVVRDTGPVEVVLNADDVDEDPFSFIPITPIAIDNFDEQTSTWSWSPDITDVGAHSVQFVATDPYGVSTLAYLVTVTEAPVAETGSWSAVATLSAPAGRTGHTLVSTGDDIIVWGGSTALEFSSGTGGVYNLTSNTWTPTSTPLNGYAAQAHSAVWTGSEMIVWGGLTSTISATNEGQIYDPVTDTWTLMSTVDAPSARYAASAVWTGSEMIVWGGATVDGATVSYLNDGAKYTPSTDTWTSIAASSLAARQSAGATFMNDQMVVWGGSSWSAETGNVYYSDGETYNPVNDSWSTLPVGSLEGRVGHAFTNMNNGSFLIWGGQGTDGNFDNGAYFDLPFITWTDMTVDDAPDPRTFMAYGGSDNTFVVWGGVDADGSLLSTGGVFDQQIGTWLATSNTDVPSARQLSQGVWTGTGLFVWGGISAGATLENTGGVFTPSSGSGFRLPR